MCDECHQHPHATMCPMNPALADDDPIMKRCPICEREFPEEDMDEPVCAACLEAGATYENALKYGESHKESISINGFLAYSFDADEIEDILKKILETVSGRFMVPSNGAFVALDYCFEDNRDFADWLVEQKKGGG